MRVEEVLVWFLFKINGVGICSSMAVDGSGITYRHGRHLLISSLTPGIVDEAFLSSFQGRGKLGCRRRFFQRPARQLEQAGRSMEGYPAIMLNL